MRTSRRISLGVFMLTAALAAAMTWAANESPTPAQVVHIRGMRFDPAKLEVTPGSAVTWVNDDIVVHAVKSTGNDDPWQSVDLPPHASWTKTFERSATYVCPYHPTMTGAVIVGATERDSASH